MSIEGIFNRTFALLERSLDLRSLNQRVLASNIANSDTPNYKAIELAVSDEMARQKTDNFGISLVRTHADHLPPNHRAIHQVQFKKAKAPEFNLRGDGNTVDIDRTMGEMAKNTLLYNAAAQLITNKFRGLKNVIKGGDK